MIPNGIADPGWFSGYLEFEKEYIDIDANTTDVLGRKSVLVPKKIPFQSDNLNNFLFDIQTEYGDTYRYRVTITLPPRLSYPVDAQGNYNTTGNNRSSNSLTVNILAQNQPIYYEWVEVNYKMEVPLGYNNIYGTWHVDFTERFDKDTNLRSKVAKDNSIHYTLGLISQINPTRVRAEVAFGVWFEDSDVRYKQPSLDFRYKYSTPSIDSTSIDPISQHEVFSRNLGNPYEISESASLANTRRLQSYGTFMPMIEKPKPEFNSVGVKLEWVGHGSVSEIMTQSEFSSQLSTWYPLHLEEDTSITPGSLARMNLLTIYPIPEGYKPAYLHATYIHDLFNTLNPVIDVDYWGAIDPDQSMKDVPHQLYRVVWNIIGGDVPDNAAPDTVYTNNEYVEGYQRNIDVTSFGERLLGGSHIPSNWGVPNPEGSITSIKPWESVYFDRENCIVHCEYPLNAYPDLVVSSSGGIPRPENTRGFHRIRFYPLPIHNESVICEWSRNPVKAGIDRVGVSQNTWAVTAFFGSSYCNFAGSYNGNILLDIVDDETRVRTTESLIQELTTDSEWYASMQIPIYTVRSKQTLNPEDAIDWGNGVKALFNVGFTGTSSKLFYVPDTIGGNSELEMELQIGSQRIPFKFVIDNLFSTT